MKRMGMVIGIRPERIAEYKRTHAAVWPEVLAKISDCNITQLHDLPARAGEPAVRLFRVSRRRLGGRRRQDGGRSDARRNGGRSTSRCRRRSRRARKATGGRWPRKCSITTERTRRHDASIPPRSARPGRRRRSPKPIVTIGAGSIVVDAHFPAYRQGGLSDRRRLSTSTPSGRETRRRASSACRVFGSLDEALATRRRDLRSRDAARRASLGARARCRPARASSSRSRWAPTSTRRPRSSKVCRERKLTAAVNFQLRFAPMMLAVRDALDRGLLGRLVDVEVASRDRHAMGSVRLPQGPAARRDRGPFDPLSRSHPRLSRRSRRACTPRRSAIRRPTWRRPARPRSSTMATRSAAAMSINHNHAFGRKHQVAEFRFDGTEGAALRQARRCCSTIRAASRTNCGSGPKGETDWVEVPLHGGWFPDAFVGRMANLQRFVRRRGHGARRLGRGRLDDDGAGRGGVRIEREAGDAA